MASKLLQDFTEFTLCCICKDRFTRPKFLPCFHTFCESCLSSWISSRRTSNGIMCPLCKKVGRIPYQGVRGYPDNLHIKNLQEVITKAEREASQHESTPETKCSVHEDVSLVAFCKACGEFLCVECFDDHSGHKTISLGKCEKEITKDAETKLLQISEREKKLAERKKSIEKNYSDLMKLVEKVTTALRQEKDQRHNGIRQKLEQLTAVKQSVERNYTTGNGTRVEQLMEKQRNLQKLKELFAENINTHEDDLMKDIPDFQLLVLQSSDAEKHWMATQLNTAHFLPVNRQHFPVLIKENEIKLDCSLQHTVMSLNGEIIVASLLEVMKFNKNGTLVWKSDIPLRYVSIRNGTIYGIDGIGIILYRLCIKSGNVLSEERLPFSVNCLALNKHGDLFVVSENDIYWRPASGGQFEALAENLSQCEKPSVPLARSQGIFTSPNGCTFILQMDGTIFKVTKKDNQFIYSVIFQGASRSLDCAIDSDGNVFSLSSDGKVFFDTSCGNRCESQSVFITNPNQISYQIDEETKEYLLVGKMNSVIICKVEYPTKPRIQPERKD